MAFSFLDPSNLKDFVHDSDEYMEPHFRDLAEMERLGRGRPGRIPKGKPRVTDNTLAGMRRETPKRIIQQIPTGIVTIKKFPEYEPHVNAVLTDEILPFANAGGTPYSKSKKALKDVFTQGASAALVFYNRHGDRFGADFRRVYIKDVGFEQGKTSEFDCNAMKITAWYTKMDLKAIIHYQEQIGKSKGERKEKYESDWNLKLLAQLLDEFPDEKDWERMSEAERKACGGVRGYYKIEHCMQIGKDAKFYSWSPKLEKVVKTCTNKDPRGIIPVHLLVPEEDDASPIGEPLLSISAGKQNLLDFDMQMYQYTRGILTEPPVKKWGSVPSSAIKLSPGSVINMGASKESGDFETVDINNSAITDYRNNAGYIKTQIYNEQGTTTDSSISSNAGTVGYGKTPTALNQQEQRLGISDNDLRKTYEEWFGRICETMLNIHFAESKGIKELDAEKSTIKRLKLDPEDLKVDYDKEYGPIKFSVDASTSEASDSKRENEELIGLLEITSKFGGLRPDRQMAVVNQVIQNSGVDDAENLQYTDEEIDAARDAALNPQPEVIQPPEEQPMPEMPMQQPIEGEVVGPAQEQLPMSQNAMPGQDDDEAVAIKMLAKQGYSDDQIADAIELIRADYSDEDIARVLGAPQGGM